MTTSLLRNIGTLATCPFAGEQGDIGLVKDAALVWSGGTIVWCGRESDLPRKLSVSREYDAGKRLVIPGLIDCHTHLAFWGWRSDEFEMRILGKSYLEIEAAGGGIVSTVRKTREASKEDLKDRALEFLRHYASYGVTAVEAKSGYGLTLADEIKILEVYRLLATEQPLTIVPTFLGAHTIPPEFKDNRAGYVDLVVNEMLPTVVKAKLARFCDVFVETSAFSLDEGRRILGAARALGLGTKIHADQFSDSGGAALAAECGATSADHLEQTGEAGRRALASSGTVAVMLPLASLYTNQRPANAREFINSGCRVAVATDFNPGSAPSYHLPYAMFLACTMNRMTPAEALKGATSVAAKAIGLEVSHGSLEAGRRADFAIVNADDVNGWMYHLKEERILATVCSGELVSGSL